MITMSNFKRLNTKIYEELEGTTEDAAYWKKFGAPVQVKEFGPIDYVSFSPIEPYHFAVTCSMRVQIYNPITKLVVKNLSRFRESAFGGTFKSDGKLLLAGGGEGTTKLFDVNTKSLLRLYKGHSAAVHRNYFVPDKPQIISCSDDKSIKLWDMATENELSTFMDHSDYIRAGVTSPISSDIFISGGYDNKINMYDLRTNKVIRSLDHGAPVEALLYLPSGGMFLSAGGNEIKVWDVHKGCFKTMNAHHKTVTCLTLASGNKRILSGSLDRHVKVYDFNFEVVQTLNYPASIVSLGISKNDDTLVAGFVDGIVSIQRRIDDKKEEKITAKKTKKYEIIDQVDTYIPEVDLEKEAEYDKYLRKFKHSKALSSVFLKYVTSKTPEKTVAVLAELMSRQALGKAFKDKDEKFIKKFLQFAIRKIKDPRFKSVIIRASYIFLDELGDSIESCVENSRLLVHFESVLEEMAATCEDLNRNDYMLDFLRGMQQSSDTTSVGSIDRQLFVPSFEAQKRLVVDID